MELLDTLYLSCETFWSAAFCSEGQLHWIAHNGLKAPFDFGPPSHMSNINLKVNGNIQLCVSCLRLVKLRLPRGLDQYFPQAKFRLRLPPPPIHVCALLGGGRIWWLPLQLSSSSSIPLPPPPLTDDRLLRGAFISLMKRRPEGGGHSQRQGSLLIAILPTCFQGL